MVTRASRVPLGDTGCETLADVIAVAARLRSATDAVLLAATAALEAARAGSGRSALRERARLSNRDAKRTVETGEQVALMPNVARGLAAGELNVEHAAVLADAARRTGPDAVDSAAELLEAAAQVSPETLRDQAKKFAARHDPAAVESELGRQRRERCASLFVDESTGMGVLHAEFDPVSFALVRQALENYNDALWHLDGGRDATPNQIRDNRQRLADSLFEMVTDRNALAAIGHPAAHPPTAGLARKPTTGTAGVAMTGTAGAAMTTRAATAMPDTASARTHMPTTTPRTVRAAAPGSARAAMLHTATKAKPNPTKPATPHTATTPTLTATPRTLEASGMALRGPARKATSPRRARRVARSIAGGPRKHPITS